MITIIQKRILLFIIFGAFGISLIHSFYFRIQPIVDARAYDNIATNLASGKGYLEDASAPKEKDAAIARVGPGYELFLAGVYKIFGHHYKIIWFFCWRYFLLFLFWSVRSWRL
ncbi:MAG: hypothetical protein NTX55_02110 [Candidatus Parcubacteria bacterium]|nr:hypothetical protein [Candidatus Parcubacteria bacterium]